MKKFFYVVLFSFFVSQLHAQTPTLTKGETISYLDKKIKESIGHNWTNNNGTIGKISSASVIQTEKGIKIEFRIDYQRTISYEFNPKLISSVTEYTNGTSSPVNEIRLSLNGNVCIHYNNGQTNSVSYGNLPYLKADADNFQKISKAFNHLKALLAAEDDPFGQ
ncbi:MAG TPA: hypothetical protein DHW64_00535 [Chitinophagaceae bacterium]|jgi:hypothetical protein|nr:hypothetical protein [Chitinophagaceae bacterium]